MGHATDLRIVRLKLDDAIVQDADRYGEKLRFAIAVDGKQVLLRFPLQARWDEFVADMTKLMLIFNQTAGDIEMNTDLYDNHQFSNHCLVLAYVISVKGCRELIDKIFYGYMRPVVEGLVFPPIPKFKRTRKTDPFATEESHAEDFKAAYTEHWLRKHIDMSHSFAMLQSICQPEEWFKKKAQQTLPALETFQRRQKQSSTPSSPPDSIAPQPSSDNSALYSFAP